MSQYISGRQVTAVEMLISGLLQLQETNQCGALQKSN